MASRAKPTGARRRTTTRTKKPATIDLKATEVKAEPEAAQTPAAKDTQTASKPVDAKAQSKSEATKQSSEQKFGREAAKPNGEPSNAGKKEPASAPPKQASKSDDPKTGKVASAPPQQKQRSGIGGGLIGGIMGSLATVAGLGIVGQMDSAPSFPLIGSLYEKGGTDTGGGLTDIASRLDALEAASGSSTNANVDLSSIEGRIAKLEALPVDESPEIGNKLSSVETEVALLKDAVGAITNAVEVDSETSTSQVSAALAAIANRLDVVENGINAAPNGNATELDNVLAKVAELEVSLAEITQSSQVDLTPIENTLAEVQSSVSALKGSVDSNSQGVAALNEQSSTLTETVASVKQSEKVARSVAVNALGTALENDDPLNLALASVKSLVGDTPETQRLSKLAESGIPTKRALLSQLSELSNTVQNPQADLSSDSMSDRFWGSLQNLVTFRSSGAIEGDGVVAVLSRVRATLEQGDLSAVLSEWQKLPQEVQASGESFQANVKIRMEAFSMHEKLNKFLAETAS